MDNLSQKAKTFILSQVRHARSKKKSVKWTEDEKALYLALYKSAPKGYRFLQNCHQKQPYKDHLIASVYNLVLMKTWLLI